ncbi:DUF2232 domain-containing protein [Ancylobacter terrae]|uniref:DUF2232 domain-containing protein n=1 Tax=Ancylobacter sp. sgz301288 TaxID=3342077 RepID=UPI00385DCCBD
MLTTILIALGAGAASALLVAAVATGSALSVPLFYLAPLPVLIVGLGWSHRAALIAAGAGTIAIGSFFGHELLVAYAAGVGGPAYVLSFLALMARAAPNDGALEWFPVGRIVLAAAIAGTLTVLALVPLVAGDIDTYKAALRTLFEAELQARTGELQGDAGRFVDLLVTIMPPTAAALTMLTQIGNLWLAGRIVRTSGRLMRPWPDLAAASLPREAGLVFLGSLGVALGTSGLLGLVGTLLTATLAMAFALVGLATIHAITRGAGGRALVIATVWLACLILVWPFALVAVLGFVETAFGLRARFSNRGSGPPAANDR